MICSRMTQASKVPAPMSRHPWAGRRVDVSSWRERGRNQWRAEAGAKPTHEPFGQEECTWQAVLYGVTRMSREPKASGPDPVMHPAPTIGSGMSGEQDVVVDAQEPEEHPERIGERPGEIRPAHDPG